MQKVVQAFDTVAAAALAHNCHLGIGHRKALTAEAEAYPALAHR